MSRVLVVDDEAGIRKVVRDALEREGHEVATCVDGQEALERLEEGVDPP
jgi:CheY-like chemotaxis protein